MKCAVETHLFAVPVTNEDGKTDKIAARVNICTDMVRDFCLLIKEKCKAKIYEIQSKLIKFPKTALHSLP